ncbi:ROK family protein [Enterococcus sp. LJL120]
MSSNKNLIRDKNLQTLKVYLFQKGQALKAEMAKDTGLSVVTINALVKELLAQNIFTEGELVQPPLGRPAINYYFNYDQSHFLLLSIQQEQVAGQRKLIFDGRVVNLKGTQKMQKRLDFTPISLENFTSVIQQYLQAAEEFTIEKIGLSLPGKIYQGKILSSWETLFDGWEPAAALEKITDIPLVMQNDAHLLTVGYAKKHRLPTVESIVGIYYPENSMPGITIYDKGALIEGGHNLAGEAKYLPHLIDGSIPTSPAELLANLTQILAIYNAVIAPDTFIISAESVQAQAVQEMIAASDILSKQMNQPAYLFDENFQQSLTVGLLWLVTLETIYHF